MELCAPLLYYLSVDELIVMYFVSKSTRERVQHKEVLHHIWHRLDLGVIPSTLTLWTLVQQHDSKVTCCRSLVAHNLLHDKFRCALSLKDYVSAELCCNLGYSCNTWLQIAVQDKQDFDSVVRGTVVTPTYVGFTVAAAIAYYSRYISYREVIFLLRYGFCFKYTITGPIATNITVATLNSGDISLYRDVYRLVGKERIVTMAVALGYKHMLFFASMVPYEQDLISVIIDAAKQYYLDVCIQWAQCYSQVYPQGNYTKAITKCTVQACNKVTNRVLYDAPFATHEQIGQIIATIIENKYQHRKSVLELDNLL